MQGKKRVAQALLGGAIALLAVAPAAAEPINLSSGSATHGASNLFTFVVPYTGVYRVTLAAGSGGNSMFAGGRGIVLTGDLTLNMAQSLTLFIGGQGWQRQGGGGSFLSVRDGSNSNLLMAAGGGGGGSGGGAGLYWAHVAPNAGGLTMVDVGGAGGGEDRPSNASRKRRSGGASTGTADTAPRCARTALMLWP